MPGLGLIDMIESVVDIRIRTAEQNDTYITISNLPVNNERSIGSHNIALAPVFSIKPVSIFSGSKSSTDKVHFHFDKHHHFYILRNSNSIRNKSQKCYPSAKPWQG